MPDQPTHLIHLQRAAPAKPAPGAPCNGCGVCCALETCPVARLRFRQVRGPCPALIWQSTENRYRCGLLADPGQFLRGLPRMLIPLVRRLCSRWIAAGSGCDCDYEMQAETGPETVHTKTLPPKT